MQELRHSYVTVWTEVRRAIETHRDWVEDRLGVKLSETAIVQPDVAFQDAAIEHLTGYLDPRAAVETSIARLLPQVQSVEMPPAFVPAFDVTTRHTADAFSHAGFGQGEEMWAHSLNWCDGPILMRLHGLTCPFIAFCVPCHPGPDSSCERYQRVVVIARTAIRDFMAMLKQLKLRDGRPKLIVAHDPPQFVSKCGWDELVLDETITSLLKADFCSFFERADWFKKMRLPFRRGYLLHGPPGNGKSTAIRAMMTSRGLTAYTIRFFDEHVDDDDLESIFRRAAQNAPAIVLLEDIDRAFPRTGESKVKVSLQQLLNCLDGVASGEGIITVATANEPTALDSAILRRPGRFDRVILFPNPTPELRQKYFSLVHPSFSSVNLDEAVEQSEGFSFAQLREAYILAAQAGFFASRDFDLEDLLTAIWSLRRTLLSGSLKASTGFAGPTAAGKTRRE